MKYLLYVVLYIGCVIGNTGFLLANLYDNPRFYVIRDKDYRSDLGAAAGISLVPVTWLMTPFMTGFYEHGWRLRKDRSK